MRIQTLAAVFLLSAGAAQAGTVVIPTPSGSVTDTTAFAGLNWTFGPGGSTPQGVLGVSRIKTESDGGTRGARLQVLFGFGGKFSMADVKVKLTGMAGTRNGMGELGLGFGRDGLFATGGVWAPYVNAGVDYNFAGSGATSATSVPGLEYYIGIHTQKRPDLPAATTPPPVLAIQPAQVN